MIASTYNFTRKSDTFFKGTCKDVALFSAVSGAEQLKELENYGLIKREAFNESPPKVEYSLTELGKSLIPVINAMCTWGQNEGRMVATLI